MSKTQIEEAMERAGLRRDLGKGWTPVEMAIRNRERLLREESEEEA